MKTIKFQSYLLLTCLTLCCTRQAQGQNSMVEVQKINNLCKVWGFLKYFHPEVAKGKIDWDQQFMTRVNEVVKLDSKEAESDYYLNWIDELGKVKKCRKCVSIFPDSVKFNLNEAWLSDSITLTHQLLTKLDYIKRNRNQKKNFYVQQTKGVKNMHFNNEKVYVDSVFPSQAMRLLSLSRYWNIINYFYPYTYLTDQDWNDVLVEMIDKFRYPKDTVEYHLAITELTAKLRDSHASIGTSYINQYFGKKWIPFYFKIIDGKVVVKGPLNDSLCKLNDIRVGDVFLTAKGQTIDELVHKNAKYIGASNYATLLRDSYEIFNGNTDSVETTFDRNGVVYHKTLKRYLFSDLKYVEDLSSYDTVKIINGDIGYVHMYFLTVDEVDSLMIKFKDTKAIIFDVRTYPKGTMYGIASHLNPEPRPFAKFTYPDFSYPGIFQHDPSYYCGKVNPNPFLGKVILLCNENAQSHAEFTLMALQTAPNSITIGSQTAGADGNVSKIYFPGKIGTYMTGIGIYYPDGRETQRIGIVPDIEIHPTIKGIREGRDEVLEKAIEIASE